MLELKANYYCRVCGHIETGINIDSCPKCGSEDILPKVDIKDLRILPQMFQIAESTDDTDHLNYVKVLLSKASFTQACGIMDEAKELLLVLFQKSSNTKMNDSEKRVITKYGKEIGEIAKSILTLKKYS